MEIVSIFSTSHPLWGLRLSSQPTFWVIGGLQGWDSPRIGGPWRWPSVRNEHLRTRLVVIVLLDVWGRWGTSTSETHGIDMSSCCGRWCHNRNFQKLYSALPDFLKGAQPHTLSVSKNSKELCATGTISLDCWVWGWKAIGLGGASLEQALGSDWQGLGLFLSLLWACMFQCSKPYDPHLCPLWPFS